jgi:anti-sigma regulatory factor (Ser/Thr protein kinase)
LTAATVTNGLVHSVGFYSSDEEFVDLFLPFCRDGSERGEATLVRLEPAKADLLRSALGDPAQVEFLPHDDEYAHAPGAMASALELVERHTEQGASRVRLLGQLPELTGLSRDAWLRYEAAANRVLATRPVDALCAVERRTVSDTVHAALLRTHHTTVAVGGVQTPSDSYQPPETFVADRREEVRDALEDTAPAVVAWDPTPSDARQAVGDLADAMQLDPLAAHSLLLAMSEVLGNAIMHGVKPVSLRAWARPGRLVVAVRDNGPGPSDPFVGLVPVTPGVRVGGLGLWIAHQVCPEIALSVEDGGFTVRLGVGAGEHRG